jgi:sugar lactone lactonase YvrE
VPDVADATLVLDARATLGEGPCWDTDGGSLLWVDIERGLVHRFDPATGGDDALDVGRRVSAAVPASDGRLVLACQGGIEMLDEAAGERTLLAPVSPGDARLRTNDAKCDASGRLWVGTMTLDDTAGAGSLFCLAAADAELRTVLPDVTISNGLGWSPDGDTMYFVDTPLGRIDAFDFDVDRGAISNRRPFAATPGPGLPDGLCVDEEGCVWVALWGGGAVHRYDASGRLVAVVALPVPDVTSCCFGGDALQDLYVTTAGGDAATAPDDLAGGLFRVEAGVRGLPGHRFAT